MNLIKFFAIMRDSGETLVSVNLDDRLEENLISGFLTALYSFGFSSFKEKMSKLSLESNNMRIDSLNMNFNGKFTLISVAYLAQEVSHQDFVNFAKDALKIFADKYHDYLNKFDGEIGKYDSFKVYINKKIEEKFSNSSNSFNEKLDDVFNKIINGDLSGLEEF